MSEEMKGYVTVHKAAKAIGRSTEQVRRYLREGKLEGQRIGGQWFIREAAVGYRTKRDEGLTMSSEEFARGAGSAAVALRLEMAERVARRREEIAGRWERRIRAASLSSGASLAPAARGECGAGRLPGAAWPLPCASR